jgi:ADP-ribosylation factor GTPase-activating protein 2/3
VEEAAGSGSQTPTGEPDDDDFFSSWDKPTIKRPSNPPSRTATPPVVSRTASPFLAPGTNGNGTARPKSPLNATDSAATPTSSAATPRTTSSAAIRKTTSSAAGARKPNILGAKKTKLGAKKITPDLALDFEEAEKKAKEEAERIAKLGYNPDEETPSAATPNTFAVAVEESKIVSPAPTNPSRGFGATTNERSSAEVSRLGMGIGRLGFGQVGAAKPAPPAKKMGGFGSTGRPVEGNPFSS